MENTENKFPVFEYDIKLIQDGEQNAKYGWTFEGLPEGRVWNRITGTTSFKSNPTVKELQDRLVEIIDNCFNNQRGSLPKIADLNPEITKISIEYKEHSAWIGGWFSHYTYNTHLGDSDLLSSFERFVAERYPFTLSYFDNDYNLFNDSVDKSKQCCLMGAEDRWRWKGPCRCEGCQKNGIVKIDH